MPQYSQMFTVEKQKVAGIPEFADAHCHLGLFDTPNDTVEEARSKGVTTIITAGGSGKDNFKSAMIAEREGVFAVVGIGPDFSASDYSYLTEIEGLVRNSRKIVGIGEIGLDAGVVASNKMELQKEVFAKQIKIAEELELPVVLHSRGMLDEVTKMLAETQPKRVMFHFFEGDEKQALELAEKGYFISIPPALTGKRKRIIKEVELSSLVVETDSPIVGKTPADVVGVCRVIAEIKGISLEDVATKTTENIRRLFYI